MTRPKGPQVLKPPKSPRRWVYRRAKVYSLASRLESRAIKTAGSGYQLLQSYLDEYAWRYNTRTKPLGLFEQLLRRAVSP